MLSDPRIQLGSSRRNPRWSRGTIGSTGRIVGYRRKILGWPAPD